MSLQQVYPDERPVDDLDALYTTPELRWLRTNLITSIDGRAGGFDGTSASLTRGDDRKVLGAIRRASDVVLIGAESFRREGYLVPKAVPLAIVSASGDLRGAVLPPGIEDGRVIVICPSSAVERVSLPGAQIVGIHESGRLTGGAIVAALHALGHHSIVCEGGPTLAAHLMAAGLVDEVCLSTSPVLVGDSSPVFALGGHGLQELELSHVLVDDAGVSYTRWSPYR